MTPTRIALAIIAVVGLTGAGRAETGNAPGLTAAVEIDAQTRAHLMRNRAWLLARDRALAKLPTTVKPLQAGDDVEVLESKTALSFDIPAGQFTGSTELTIKALTATSQIYLYIYELTSGTTQVSDSQGALPTYDQGNGVIAVTLSQTLAVGQSVVLTVNQSGTPECNSSFLSLVTCMISSNITFALGAWQPQVYDVSTGRLLGATSATLEVNVPATMLVGSTGTPGSTVTNPDGTKTITYTNDLDGTFCFGAANYVSGSLAFGAGKTAVTHLLPASATYAADWRSAMADVIAFHSTRYGPYDPPSIGMVELPDSTGAAFGPYTAIFMPSILVGYPPTHWSITSTLAHELGHQWFGGMIDNWDNTTPWLNEGFASFAEMEYTASEASKEYGLDYGPYGRRYANRTYVYTAKQFGMDVPIASPMIYKAPSSLYVALVYDKGPLVVDMLRYLLGSDSAFFAAIKAYRADHEGKGADVKSFKASVEKASGKDFTAFLTHWLYSAGYPMYSVQLTRGAAGSTQAQVVITADKDFGMPLELEIVSQDKVERVKLPVSAQNPTVFKHTATAATEVLSVRFDPDHHIVGRALGELPGDIHVNGEVDGIDLINAAMAQGQLYDPSNPYSTFPEWADLVFDGTIDDKDLDLVTRSFGKRTGE